MTSLRSALRYLPKAVATLVCYAGMATCASAQETGTGSYCGSYRVGHINGVKTPQNFAVLNVEGLKDTFGPQFRNSYVGYFLAYNPTGGLPTDAAEVLAQKQVEFPGGTDMERLRHPLIDLLASSRDGHVDSARARSPNQGQSVPRRVRR